MSDSIVISAQGLTKSYRIWRDPSDRIFSPLWANLAKTLPEPFKTALNKKATEGYHDFFALSDISFEVKRGEAVGIIGRNGAGKSTLLQIIAGTLQPSAGTIAIEGRVAALLELGAGFNPEFTGRENILLTGAIIGLSKQDMMSRFDDITQFADIGEFIEQPIKTYSSGMMVRLAFAVQTAIEPDILIIDEALSVGDVFFQQKCAARMRELRAKGTTLLFVSHDLASVRDLCERTLYLRKGKAVFWGDTQKAVYQYYNEGSENIAQTSDTSTSNPLPAGEDTEAELFRRQSLWWTDFIGDHPTKPVSLIGIAMLDQNDLATERIQMGQKIRFKVLFRSSIDSAYHVVVEIKNRRDELVTSCSSYTCGQSPLKLKQNDSAYCELQLDFNLEAGRYTFQIILASVPQQANRSQRLDESPWLGPLDVNWDYDSTPAPFLGMFGPPVSAHFTTITTHRDE